MAAQSGRQLRILRSNSDSPETFTAITGAREESLSINNELIDITDKSSSGWRTYLSGVASMQSMTLSASGVTVDETMIEDMMAKTEKNYQLDINGLGVFEGAFMIPTLEQSGSHNGEITYSITLESSGAITYTSDTP